MTPKGRIGGKTPERVVTLITEAVAKSSQSAVARESGLGLLTVQRCLKGIGEPSQATLEKLAAYFDKTVAWLRGEEENFSVVTMGIPTTNIRGIAAAQSEHLVLFKFKGKMIFATSRNEFCTESIKLLGSYFSKSPKKRNPEKVLSAIENIWINKAENIEEFLAHNGNKMMFPDEDFQPQELDLDKLASTFGDIEIIEVKPIK